MRSREGRGDPSVWLDASRHPGRRFLPSLGRGRRPVGPAAEPWTFMRQGLCLRWGALLGVADDDLVPCASVSEAFRLVLGALLLPGEVCALGEPVDAALIAAIAGAGGAWVDLSRDAKGRVGPAAVALALERHPEALFFACRPSLFGGDDLEALAGAPPPRAVLADARADAALAGSPPSGEGPHPLATLVALRDPDAPAEPLLYAWVCAPGTGPGLMELQGPAPLSPHLLPQALAALGRLEAEGPICQRAFERRLGASRARFETLAAAHAGAVMHPGHGVLAVAECLAGDAAALAEVLLREGLPCTAWGPHPTRNLVVCDLPRARVPPRRS